MRPVICSRCCYTAAFVVTLKCDIHLCIELSLLLADAHTSAPIYYYPIYGRIILIFIVLNYITKTEEKYSFYFKTFSCKNTVCSEIANGNTISA